MFGFLKRRRKEEPVATPPAQPAPESAESAALPPEASIPESAESALNAPPPAEVPSPVAQSVAAAAPVEQAAAAVAETQPEAVAAVHADDMTGGAPVATVETVSAAVPATPVEAPEPVAEAEAEAEAPVVTETAERPAKLSWAERLKQGLSRTRQQLGGGLAQLFGRRKIDEDLLEELETTLLMADCGVEATEYLLTELRQRWKRDRLETADQLQQALMDALETLLKPLEQGLDISGHKPYIIMLAGVNGAGKTTSIGKLAKYFQAQGKSVLLAAGDTFRAAAREQLITWGERNNVSVIAQESGDAAAVIFDAIHAAKARGIDIVIADTAGRLPTQLNLMEEIAKVRRVITKAEPSGPHEVLLVLDANIGQNALAQVKAFDAAINVTGLVVTKLDGTAKGGVVAAIARQTPKPLRFIGVGEGIDDLQPFRVREFVEALFAPQAESGRKASHS